MEPPPFTKDPAGTLLLARHRAPLSALTGIRFFAAALVVAFHSRISAVLERGPLRPVGLVIEHGYSAVTLFFLLSGFILAYTYSGQVERAGTWRRFYEARFARLWPLYFTSLLLSSLAFRFVPPTLPAFATLLMVQAWDPWNASLAATWNFVCWTLSCEALFYVLFPPVQRWLDAASQRSLWAFLVASIGVSVIGNTNGRTLGALWPTGWTHWLPLAVVHVPEFLTGVALGSMLLRRVARAQVSALPGHGAWTWLSAAASFLLLGQANERLMAFLPATFAALLFGLAVEDTWLRRLLSMKLLLIGGGMSYAMYLLQVPVKYAVSIAAASVGVASVGLRLLLNFVVLLLISWVLFHLVENPARMLLRRMFAAIEARRSPGPRSGEEIL